MPNILWHTVYLTCLICIIIVSIVIITFKLTSSIESESRYSHKSSSVSVRRRIYTNVQYIWNILHFGLKHLENITTKSGNNLLEVTLKDIITLVDESKILLHSNIEQLAEYDGFKLQRQKQSEELSMLVQARLKYLQNPKNCSTARKLLCNLATDCGFACQIHHLLFCLIYAYGSQRTLILNSTGWNYNEDGWEDVFQPLSDTCTISLNDSSYSIWPGTPDTQVVFLGWVAFTTIDPYYEIVSVPEDLADSVQRFHGAPDLWWLGQLLKYILRLNDKTKSMIQHRMKVLGFQKPIVGIHVRRTDKLDIESKRFELSEYMEYADQYFKKLELIKPVERRIFLATDLPEIIEEVKMKYVNYSIITNPVGAKTACYDIRFSKESLNDLILDILLLAHSDYLICTFTSNFGRLVYEFMQALLADGSDQFMSLDINYYYWGGNSRHLYVNDPVNPLDSRAIQRSVPDRQLYFSTHNFTNNKVIMALMSAYGKFPRFLPSDKYAIEKYPNYSHVLP